MNVRLISYSKAPDGVQLEDCQELVAYCARVSNPSNQMNAETSAKLIKYLIKHKHWSPLEMVNACLEIETTRDIAHQIVRHRSFAFQEFSQRYAKPEDMGDARVLRDARFQDPKNRQNSIALDRNDEQQRRLNEDFRMKQASIYNQAQEVYNWAINNGIAKEQARVVLPEGNTKTRLYMNGSLRSWVHYIELRGANGTQLEHMEIAQQCAVVIAEIFPLMEKLDEIS